MFCAGAFPSVMLTWSNFLNKGEKKIVNRKSASIAILAIFITSVFFAAPAAYAADARVYISAVSPAKSGYAVDEVVTINGKIKWEDLTANKTIRSDRV